MQSLVPLLLLTVSAFSGSASTASSDQPADKLTVVLEGEGDAELAPHGKGNVYAPDVMRDGELFRMWYGGQDKDGHDRISYAESVDGTNWVRKGVVLKDDKANHVNDPSVVKAKGRYYLYYTRTEKDVVDRIDVAVSDDGRKWEPQGVALAAGPEGTWDALSVGRPTVIFDDGLFRMWYDGRKDFPPGAPVKGVPTSPTSRRSVGYATSEDGIKWARYKSNPVYGNDAGAADVKRVGDQLIMLYESPDGTRWASSTDGVGWNEGGVFIRKSGSTIDGFGHVTPFLLVDPDRRLHRLFIGAAGAATWDHNRIAVLDIGHNRLKRIVASTDAFDIKCRKSEDRVNVALADGEVVFTVTSPSGIGGATIERTGEKWPKAVILRLHLRGLESLAISCGDMKLSASVLSHSGNARLLHLVTTEKEGPQLTKDSPYWTEVRVLDASGKAATGLPDRGGYFELAVPKALLEQAKAVKIEWIDFYRG